MHERFGVNLISQLDESQKKAVVASFSKIICDNESHVELICGPPGTGKSMTVVMILFALLRMNYRTLSCVLNNAAVIQVSSQLIKQIKESFTAESGKVQLPCSLGDILLFWDGNPMNLGSDVRKVCLEYRVKRLLECFSPVTGWKSCIASTIKFLEDWSTNNLVIVENELMEIKELKDDKMSGDKHKQFLLSGRAKFKDIVMPLKRCVISLCTHVPKQFLREKNFENMENLIHLLQCMEKLLFQDGLASVDLNELFSQKSQCLAVLKLLRQSLKKISFPTVHNENSITEFCFQKASLIFCTYSSSYKLHFINMEPINLLVIDDATQLKESESLIPLQLNGLKHVLLAGDECQSLVTCTSKVSKLPLIP